MDDMTNEIVVNSLGRIKFNVQGLTIKTQISNLFHKLKLNT